MTAFEQETAKQSALGGAMVAGAGLVYVHPHFPFAQAYELAEQLCSAAKSAYKNGQAQERSCLAFAHVTTALVEDITAHRIAYAINDADVDNASPLELLVSAVGDLPRGALRTWLTAYESGDAVLAERLWSRAKEVADAAAWKCLERALSGIGADPQSGALLESDVARSLAQGKRTRGITPLREALALRHLERGSALANTKFPETVGGAR